MDSVKFWRKFYREQYDKTWDKNPEQANAYLGIAIALGDTLRDMKQIAEGWNIPSSFFREKYIFLYEPINYKGDVKQWRMLRIKYMLLP